MSELKVLDKLLIGQTTIFELFLIEFSTYHCLIASGKIQYRYSEEICQNLKKWTFCSKYVDYCGFSLLSSWIKIISGILVDDFQ